MSAVTGAVVQSVERMVWLRTVMLCIGMKVWSSWVNLSILSEYTGSTISL